MESSPEPVYDKRGMRIFSKAEINSYKGKHDKDGFYILPDGDFFDPYGYYFDKEGVDNIGGFYEESTGEYISPDNYDEGVFDDYYDELVGSDSEGEEEEGNNEVDEYNIPEDVANKAIR